MRENHLFFKTHGRTCQKPCFHIKSLIINDLTCDKNMSETCQKVPKTPLSGTRGHKTIVYNPMTFEEFKRKYRHHYLRAHATGYQKAYEEIERNRAARERPQTIDNWRFFSQRRCVTT